MEEGKQEAPAYIASLRYFTTGDPECAVCEKRATIVRISTTTSQQTIITMMCKKCGTEEIDGLLERKDMLRSPDGTHLISPALAIATEAALKKVVKQQQGEAAEKKVNDAVNPDMAAAIDVAVQEALARNAEKKST